MSISALLCLLAVAKTAAGFTFSHSDPVECRDMTLRWEGGTAPFYATIVPAYPMSGARIQNVTIPASASASSTRNFSFRLDNPANLEFSVIMSDATGWGAGGVTPVLQIAGSSDKSCHTSPPPFGFYFYWDPPMSISSAQCQPLQLSWDANVVYPIQALGFVPGGGAFTIPVAQNSSSRSTTWPVRIREGAQYQILMTHSGQVTTGGSTNLTWVTAGSSSCLNANSPGAGVRVATVISAGTSATRSLTSLSMSSASASNRPASDNSGGGMSGGGGGSNVGAIAGGVVGGIAAIALILLLLFCCRRRRRQQQQHTEQPGDYASYSQAEAPLQPEMRQSTLSMGPAAVMRRATRSMGPSHASRSSFDILSRPSGSPPTPPPVETPSVDDDSVDPFVSPFPAPPPRSSFEQREGTDAVAWGARGHAREKSDGSLASLRPDAGTRNSMLAPGLVPLNTNGETGQGSIGRNSRKLSGSYNETPPQTPTIRQGSQPRSPIRSMSNSGLTRWSVDEDSEIGSMIRSRPSADRLSGVEEGGVAPSVTTFIQHNDGGPGGIVELPPSYNQLRARNPDE